MTETIAKQQMRRCAGMPAQPTDEVALRERVRALRNHSRTEKHTQKIIDSLLETCQFFPTVADIVQASGYISEGDTPGGCDQCAGEPWVAVKRGAYDASVRCNCERGKYLRARDRERVA